MIAFILGREFRLSIAEINKYFGNPEVIYVSKELAIFDGIEATEVQNSFNKLGGSIKAVKLKKEIYEKDFLPEAVKLIENKAADYDGKFNFALASYGRDKNIFTIGIQVKKELKKVCSTNLRFVNKDNYNINAATYKKEKVISGIEVNYILAGDLSFIGETIAYQDVDEYSRRDIGKERDMQVGMLPPKLAQMMINLAGNEISEVYDPFCGLGTVLIESALNGKTKVYGSDIDEKMVHASSKNSSLLNSKQCSIEVFKMDARDISNATFLKNNPRISIVTEGFLGSIMTKGHVTEDKIHEERKNLTRIYEPFFANLSKIRFSGKIVISFPFWQFKGKYYYFEEIYEILKRNGFKPEKLLPENIEFYESRSGSLLYHRPNQQVGREIFCLTK